MISFLVEKVIAPAVVEIIVKLVEYYWGNPAFKAKMDAVIDRVKKVKDERDAHEASAQLQDLVGNPHPPGM